MDDDVQPDLSGVSRANSTHHVVLSPGDPMAQAQAGLAKRAMSQPFLAHSLSELSQQAWAGNPAQNLKRAPSRIDEGSARQSAAALGLGLLQHDIEELVRSQVANLMQAREEGAELLNRSKKSVVKLFVQSTMRSPTQPWQGGMATACTGSGFAFQMGGQSLIMTNAHVVGAVHARVQVEVEKYGDSRKYLGQVLAQGDLDDNGYDLALVAVPDEAFWADVVLQPLESDAVPELMTKVVASGFPMGGEGLCNTVGAVSRITTDTKSHHLQVQIDAAINPGNSGGPVFDKDGAVVGVSVSGIMMANNIGFIIPLPVIQAFLRKAAEMLQAQAGAGVGPQQAAFYVPHPDTGFAWQALENRRTREKLGLTEGQSGVLFIPPPRQHTRFVYRDCILTGDVLLKINDSPVGNDGTIVFQAGREERVALKHALSRVAVGEELEFTVLRGGSVVVEKTPAKAYDHASTLRPLVWKLGYCVIGGLVFIPYTHYARSMEVDRYIETTLGSLYATEDIKEIVHLTSVLPAGQLNAGAQQNRGSALLSLNGVPIQSLSHLQGLVDAIMVAASAGGDCSTEMDFRFDGGYMFVLDARDCLQSEGALCHHFGLPRAAWRQLPEDGAHF